MGGALVSSFLYVGISVAASNYSELLLRAREKLEGTVLQRGVSNFSTFQTYSEDDTVRYLGLGPTMASMLTEI